MSGLAPVFCIDCQRDVYQGHCDCDESFGACNYCYSITTMIGEEGLAYCDSCKGIVEGSTHTKTWRDWRRSRRDLVKMSESSEPLVPQKGINDYD